MPIQARYVHTNLMARDWRRLVRFYCDVFGCVPRPPERDITHEWISRVANLKNARLRGMHLTFPGYDSATGPTLEIYSYDEMTESALPVANQPGYGHLAFAVDDVDAALAAVLAAGGSQVGEVAHAVYPELGTLWVVYSRDPEGNIVELQRWN